MEQRFKEITDKPERFFEILPADWQESICPFWTSYAQSARIFVLESADEFVNGIPRVLGGGIVFSTVSPDCQPMYHAEAQNWFDQGYLYIGFLWISELFRDKQLGTTWLQELYRRHPHENFWLSIDELRLSSFYMRNGFELIKKVELDYYPEWVMATNGRERELIIPARGKQASEFALMSYR